jgi:aminoglycoside phosphotransferase family enzyme/predicted kinase
MIDEALVESLRDPNRYPHPVDRIHVVETHISWVILTGQFAYKIKKPVNLGFLDFTTLDARRHFCEEEVRLNRRLEPDLYLGVVNITDGASGPTLSGAGRVLDYAVKMRQFQEQGLLDRVQARGELLPAHVDALARQIARFHLNCHCAATGSALGSPSHITQPAMQNFAQIAALLGSCASAGHGAIERLRQWTEERGLALGGEFERRQRAGFVRECHGDLHLGNAFIENGAIHIFDCIEFSEDLRWIDVMSEIAFMVMDLAHRNHPDLARRFLNAYLEATGDYAGLDCLTYYLVYRAMVRAKITLIRKSQPDVGPAEKALDTTDFDHLVRLAEEFSAARRTWLTITHGVAGSGKSHFAQQIVESAGAIRIRSDVERKRLQGLAPETSSSSGLGEGAYAPVHTQATYRRLSELSGTVLDAGWPVVVDAAFLERWQRDLIAGVARGRNVPYMVLDLAAPPAVLAERIRSRSAEGLDPSEATADVLEHQLGRLTPFGLDELPHVISSGEGGITTEAVLQALGNI